jgi:RNA polymerase sigma-70 factor (ECF subfamily)
VKTRLHRARGLLRTYLDARLDVSADRVFAFGGHRCDRMVTAVMARIGVSGGRAWPTAATRHGRGGRAAE